MSNEHVSDTSKISKEAAKFERFDQSRARDDKLHLRRSVEFRGRGSRGESRIARMVAKERARVHVEIE